MNTQTVDIIHNVVNGKVVITKVKKIYNNGKLNEVMYLNKQDQLHRDDDQPARVIYWEYIDEIRLSIWYRNDEKYKDALYRETGLLQSETYYKDNKIHRDDDQPAVINYASDGKFPICKVWYKEGKFHRDGDLPAYEFYYESNQKIHTRAWYKHGIQYLNNCLPSKEEYNKDSIITRLEWTSEEGKLHREGDLPAVLIFSEDGKTKLYEKWYKNGKLHRPLSKGSAHASYDKAGNIIIENYYLNGVIQKPPSYELVVPVPVPPCLYCHPDFDSNLPSSPLCLSSRDTLIDKIKTFSEEDIEKCLAILEIIKK